MGILARRLTIAEEQTRRLKDLSHKMSYQDFSSDGEPAAIAARFARFIQEKGLDP